MRISDMQIMREFIGIGAAMRPEYGDNKVVYHNKYLKLKIK